MIFDDICIVEQRVPELLAIIVAPLKVVILTEFL